MAEMLVFVKGFRRRGRSVGENLNSQIRDFQNGKI
jgi:hypothetical protein